MKTTTSTCLVFVTAPDLGVARQLAQVALEARLVACANLIPTIESHYWWQGRLESNTEVLILFKTTVARTTALEKLIKAHHPYDTPEIVTVPIRSGSQRYLAWLEASVRSPLGS